MRAVLSFLKLLKPLRYIFFVELLIGYLVAMPPSSYPEGAGILLAVFASFQILLYSGIYIINDLCDLSWDRQHPVKQHRPLAAGMISPRIGLMTAVAFILSGLTLGYWVNSTVFMFEIGFLLLNLLYSERLRNIAYWDLFGNVITHPLRVIFGVCIFGYLKIEHWPIIACTALLAASIGLLKRYKELDEVGGCSRPSLRKYSRKGLLLVGISCILGNLIFLFFAITPVDLSWIAFSAFLCVIAWIGYTSCTGKAKALTNYLLAS
jgi:4-hydroxybenzoate polyprenyltransferase